MSNPYNTLKEPAPIMADKWHEMNVLELQAQRLILSDRHNTMMSVISGDVSPSIMGMYTALGNSILHIDELINQRQRTMENGRNN